jgi:subtilisin family serine protease
MSRHFELGSSMRLKVWTCAVLVTVLAGTIAPASTVSAATPPASARAAERPGGHAIAALRPHTVTLITGDRLTVRGTGPGQVSVAPGPGRAHVRFLARTDHGHLQVLPSDALALVDRGVLDRRLFDVTTLIDFGYDDRRADLPLIVSYPAGPAPMQAQAAGVTAVRNLPAVNGVALRERRADAGTFWRSVTGDGLRAAAAPVRTIWLDGLRKPSLDVSVPLIGAPQAWQAGYTGAGVPVAVVDTGIDASHPDLAGRVVAEHNFTDDGDTLDHVGHGTHVASTIAGSGAASAGRYKGVAPDARLLDAKVCVLDGCTESAILAGMQWAAADQHAKVVNLSLGGPDTPGLDPVEQAVQDLTAQYGTLFVVAAGNDGIDGSVNSPATADDALAVGAVSKTEQLAEFSSRGPRQGDLGIKPDITAPGVDITAARGKDGVVGNPGDLYATLSGTSMAAPHVTGSAAILAQEHPDWPPTRLKAALMGTAKPNTSIGVYAQGAGRVDIGAAVREPVVATPASVDFGIRPFPHTDDKPDGRQITYHNAGATPVRLDLAVQTTAPAGLFTVTPAAVTVPAGGDVTATVTADTRVGGADGLLSGRLVATGGATPVQIPLVVEREQESYDVKLVHLDRHGKPAALFTTDLLGIDREGSWSVNESDNPGPSTTVRLPKGRYVLSGMVMEDQPDGSRAFSMIMQPIVDVSKPLTLTLDARKAKPASATVPKAGATQLVGNIGFEMNLGHVGFSAALLGDNFDGMSTAQLGPAGTAPGLVSNISGQWGEVGANGDTRNSPYAYLLSWFRPGAFYTGFQRTVAARDLATVHVNMAAEATGATGAMELSSSIPGQDSGGGAVHFRYDLPGSRTAYLNTDAGVRWTSLFTQETPSTDPDDPTPVAIGYNESPPTRYQAGHTYDEAWNQGVFGPVLPDPPPYSGSGLTRHGDTITVDPMLFGDRAGRSGFSLLDTATMTLYRNGKKLAKQDAAAGDFDVPPGAAQYRLELSTARNTDLPFTLSTRTTVAWTFRSGHVDVDGPVPLPISVLRFLPELDQHNTSGGGTRTFPVRVARQPGSPAGKPGQVSVQVSFDDGGHWISAPITCTGGDCRLTVKQPAGHGFVAFRSTARDDGGNTVEQTLIRAYRY